jgi:hypothetical protein
MKQNLGPGGCIPWDDFAEWLKRVDVHLKAANYAALHVERKAIELRPLWASLDALRSEVAAASVVCNVPLGPKDPNQ